MLLDALYEYVKDCENPELNFNLALEYKKIGQTASAISFFIRSADRTNNLELSYECLLHCAECFIAQDRRDNTVRGLYKHAISILPKRPEAYFLLARFEEKKSQFDNTYMLSSMALEICDFESKPLIHQLGYPGKYGLIFEKAVSSYWWGKGEESRKLFLDLYYNYWDILDQSHKDAVQANIKNLNIDVTLIKDKQKSMGNTSILVSDGMGIGRKKIIDCFRFFNEKELLELRYKLLHDKVDKFMILEGTKTYSGNDWKPLAKEYVKELNLPEEKFIFVQTNLPSNDEDVKNTEIDIIFRSFSGKSNDTYKNSLNARTRERLTLDGLLSVISQFDSRDIFFVSDCDEIIKPEYVNYFANVASNHQNKLIKVPLVELQGKANLRAYYSDTNTPISTDHVFFVCTKKHFEKATPTQMRYNIQNPYETVYITQDGKRLEECGWHFSWIGDSSRLKTKQKSISHYADRIESAIIKDFNSKELENYINEWTPKDDGLNPWGDEKIVLRNYDLNNLPSEILEFEHLKKFFIYESPIPMIGVPIVNGVHWLRRLIDSVDYPVKEFFIINNNGKQEIDEDLNEIASTKHPFIEKIRVTHLPSNLGVSGAWNLIIKSYMMKPYWVIVNHDVEFSPGLLKLFHDEAINSEYGMIHGKNSDWGGGMYDLFLIKDWVVQKCGLFDENLYPAYAEDVDYHIRVKNENIKYKSLNANYLHGEKDYSTTGSQTWRTDINLKEGLNKSRILNETEYLVKKWGSNFEYLTPFNDDVFSNNYTTYDLNFNREKNLGF